ncbi:cadherin repeat domain-containing protein, partial [Porticoccaceae bacterium]|nr:cadherin repeat domain-containing protein [Porticoccaceae bacterium]
QYIYTATSNKDDVTYSLGSKGDSSKFKIDPFSGEVILIENPDYESQNSYNFYIVATDATGDVSAAKKVTLEILNIDEKPPIIISGNTAEVLDKSGANQVIYKMIAEDDDIATQSMGNITYELSGADAASFNLNRSGEVILTADPDYTKKSRYSFSVIVKDPIGNAVTQKISLKINAPSWVSNVGTVCKGITDVASSESDGKDKVAVIELTNKAPQLYSCMESWDPARRDKLMATGNEQDSVRIALILNSNNDGSPQVFDNYEFQFNTSQVTNVKINGLPFSGARYKLEPEKRLTEHTSFVIEYDYKFPAYFYHPPENGQRLDNNFYIKETRIDFNMDPLKHTISGFKTELLERTCAKGNNPLKEGETCHLREYTFMCYRNKVDYVKPTRKLDTISHSELTAIIDEYKIHCSGP